MYTIPIIDVDLAVQEVERIALEGARAVQIPLSPWDMGLDPYWDEVYDPLWDTLQETGIPISQHVGMNSYLAAIMQVDPTPFKGIFQSLPPIFMSEIVASWIISGTLERFPGLKSCSSRPGSAGSRTTSSGSTRWKRATAGTPSRAR